MKTRGHSFNVRKGAHFLRHCAPFGLIQFHETFSRRGNADRVDGLRKKQHFLMPFLDNFGERQNQSLYKFHQLEAVYAFNFANFQNLRFGDPMPVLTHKVFVSYRNPRPQQHVPSCALLISLARTCFGCR